METTILTINDLIGLLHSYPTTEQEIGFNSAIIVLLKKMADGSNEEFNLEFLLKRAINDNFIFSKLSLSNEQELFGFLKDGKKLNFIKALKEYTGLGLKEAKDIADEFFDLVRDQK